LAGFEIIDVHVHLCRDAAQEKLVFPKAGWPDDWYWCNPERVGAYMDQRGVSHMVAVNIMDTGRMTEGRLARLPRGASDAEVRQAKDAIRDEMQGRVRGFNDWICETHRNDARVIPFVMIDPVLFGDAVAEELDRCVGLGAKGVKIHPSICGHMPDHPALMPVYERCQELGLGVLSDTGSLVNPDGETYGYPFNWVPVLSAFPRLKFIMAHLTDQMWDDRLELSRQFRDNLWFDVAGGLVDKLHPPALHREMPVAQAPRVFRKVGIDRILFGTDAPGRGDLDILERAGQIVALPLQDGEKEMILSGNAKRFLGL
jgi:predicted TIM-barrel fold metal-dependent hydrolase